MMTRHTALALIASGIVASHAFAAEDLLLGTWTNPTNPSSQTFHRPTASPADPNADPCYLTSVWVGDTDVQIGRFGTYTASSAQNVKFLIFEQAYNEQTFNFDRSLQYQTVASVAQTAGGWIDSGAISFTLLAGKHYFLGALPELPTDSDSFTFFYTYPGSDISSGGLIADPSNGGRGENYDNPAFLSNMFVQTSLRVWAAPVPEPASLSLVLCAGLLLMRTRPRPSHGV